MSSSSWRSLRAGRGPAISRGQELSRYDLREVPNEVGFPRQKIPPLASAATTAFVPPAYRVLRFQEDYFYLADPAKRVDFFDPIKYAAPRMEG